MSAATDRGVAFVTGAAQGIGAAVVRRLSAGGTPVVALDVLAEPLQAVADACHTAGGATVHTRLLDVSDSAAVARTVKEVEHAVGPIGALIHVAGILRTGHVVDLADDDWLRTMSVNLDAAFYLCRAIAPAMQRRQGGAIVAVGSNAALVPRTGMAAYAASKAALHQFIRCLGLELAPHGVRCNVVAPGSTDTPMQARFAGSPEAARRVLEGDLAAYRTGIPLGRIASPDDIADAVAFLLSDAARHITLQTLCVDGGATLGA